MKKLFLIFGFMFAFVLGTNTVNAQNEINKEAIQKFTNKVFDSKETAIAMEIKIVKENLYLRIRTQKKDNYLLVTSLKDFKSSKIENTEIVLMKYNSVLHNYIKTYINAKKQNAVAMN